MKDWAWVWGIVTVLGVVAAYMAYRKAKSSDDTAKASLTIAKRTEARETETHYVDWLGKWDEPGWFTLENTGQDDAHDVKLVLYIDDLPYNLEHVLIQGRAELGFYLAQAESMWREGQTDYDDKIDTRADEVSEQRERRKRANAATGLMANIERMSAYSSDRTVFHKLDAKNDHKIGAHDVYYRVFWRTALGSPKDSGYRKRGQERLGPDYEG